MLAAIRAQLGETGLAEALAAGRGLSLEEVVAEAMATPTPAPAAPGRQPASGAPGRLTPREREVADLLRQGYSDREIAARLSITVGTASLHVHRVLAKLQLHSRWQVTDWLARGGAPTDDTRSAVPAGGGRV
jgi:DNA-binding NarL/FixJ family response regulator